MHSRRYEPSPPPYSTAQRAFKLYAVARRHARTVMRIGGCLLIVVGLLEVSGLWAELVNRIQVLVVTWRPPL